MTGWEQSARENQPPENNGGRKAHSNYPWAEGICSGQQYIYQCCTWLPAPDFWAQGTTDCYRVPIYVVVNVKCF